MSLGVMSVVLSMLLPSWTNFAKRERENELIFRGEQYARAIELYQREYVGSYPEDLEVLVERRFLRRLFRDPMVPDGEFQVLIRSQIEDGNGSLRVSAAETSAPNESSVFQIAGPDRQGGDVVGVVSRSGDSSLRIYNGRNKYNEWAFVYVTSTSAPGEVPGDNVPREPRRGTDGVPIGEDQGIFRDNSP